MDIKGGSASYGVLAVALHWLSALAILTTIPLGFAAARANEPAQAAALLRWHLPLGLIILGLTLARIIWWLVDNRPDVPPGQPPWQHRMARATHVLLYVLILVLCGSGIGLVALSHAVPAIFSGDREGLPDVSAFPPMAVHAATAFGLIGLLVLHLGAVVYHQLYRRDHILARMRVSRPVKAS